MEVQVNTSNAVDGLQGLITSIEETARNRLSRFSDRLTRLKIHLGYENADRTSGDDKRCFVEARPSGFDPVTVTDHGATIDEATSRALGKMVSALDRAVGKLTDRKGH